ncbi:MAG: hypothetical protein ACD_60C00022G0001 [uncultured bacterium]|nr:MAG: hypothetical protein ACD_60C00022G0001 [uncultured bacterium]
MDARNPTALIDEIFAHDMQSAPVTKSVELLKKAIEFLSSQDKKAGLLFSNEFLDDLTSQKKEEALPSLKLAQDKILFILAAEHLKQRFESEKNPHKMFQPSKEGEPSAKEVKTSAKLSPKQGK